MIARWRRDDLLFHGGLVFAGLFFSNVFNYGFYMLVGRLGGVVTYGEVTSLASATLVLGAPAIVGQLIAARLAAELHAKDDRAALKRLADWVTRVTCACGAAAVVVIALFAAPIAHFFNIGSIGPVIAAGISLALYWIAYTQRGVLQGAHRFGDFSFSVALEALTKLVAGVLLVGTFGTLGGLFGFVIGIGTAALYNGLRFRMLFGTVTAPLPYSGSAIARVAGGVGLGQVVLTVLTFYDVPLVKHAFDARSAGLYAAAALVGRAVVSMCAFVPTILLPKATARMAAGRSPLPLLWTAVGIAAAIILVAAVASALVPAFVVTVIAGRAFGGAAPLVLPYVAASGALSLAMVVAAYNFGLNRYAFVTPMAVVAVAEVATLAVWHPTLAVVVTVLMSGHACVFVAALAGAMRSAPRRVPAVHEGEPLIVSEFVG